MYFSWFKLLDFFSCHIVFVQLQQLMESLIRNQMRDISALVSCVLGCLCSHITKCICFLFIFWLACCSAILVQEVSNVDGRWCIASGTNTRPSVEGLLLSRCIIYLEKLYFLLLLQRSLISEFHANNSFLFTSSITNLSNVFEILKSNTLW